MASNNAVEVAAGYASIYADFDAAGLRADLLSALSGLNTRFSVSADVTSATSALDSLASSTSAWGVGLSAAGAGITVAAKKFGTFALETASHAETAEIAITTLSGSADTAKTMMKELADFAVKTPFTNSTVTDSAEQLLALGFSAESVIPTMTAVGDAVAAVGGSDVNIKNVIHALGLMKTQGKVTSRTMLNLTNNNIRAWDFLAQKLGVTTEKAREMVQAGEVDAETGISAMVEGMENAYDGMMEKMGHTVSFVMSNLSDAVAVPLQELRDTSAYDGLTTALEGLVDPLENFVKACEPLMTGAMETAADGIEWLTNALTSLVSVEKDASGETSATLKNLRGFQAIVDMLGGIVISGPALLSFSKATKLVSAFVKTVGTPMEVAALKAASATKNLAGSIGGASVWANATAKFKAGASQAFKNNARILDENIAALQARAQQAMAGTELSTPSAAGTAITQYRESIAAMGQLGGDKLNAGPVTAFIQTIGSYASKYAPQLQTFGNGLVSFAKTSLAAFNMFGGVAISFGTKLTMVGAALAVAAGLFTTAGGSIGTLCSTIGSDISALSSMVADGISGFTMGLTAALPQLEPALGMIGTALTNAFSQIGTALTALAPTFLAATTTIAAQIGAYLLQQAPTILSAALSLFNYMIVALNQTLTLLIPQLPIFITNLGMALITNIPLLLTSALQLFQTLVTAFVSILPSLAEQIPLLITQVGTWLIEHAPEILTAAGQLFIGIVNALPALAGNLLVALASLIGVAIANIPTFLTQMAAVAGTLFRAIVDAPGKLLGSIRSKVGELINAAKEKIGSFDLTSVGKNFIQGFINGIGDMVGSLKDKAVEIGNSALDTIKHTLGIKSPSREMRKIGHFTMQGFVKGLADMESDVISEMANISEIVTDGASAGGNLGAWNGTTGYGGRVINQNFSTTVVRSDEDLYVAAPIIYRNAMAEAGALT